MPRYAELIYNGFWFSPEREMLQALIDKSQEIVEGTVRLKLYKGNVTVIGRERLVALRRGPGHLRGGPRRLRPEGRRRLHQAERAAPADAGHARRRRRQGLNDASAGPPNLPSLGLGIVGQRLADGEQVGAHLDDLLRIEDGQRLLAHRLADHLNAGEDRCGGRGQVDQLGAAVAGIGTARPGRRAPGGPESLPGSSARRSSLRRAPTGEGRGGGRHRRWSAPHRR